MAKKFQLVDTFEQRTPTAPPETNWKLCLVCQEETTESLVCPVLSKRRDPGSGYTTMAANLVKFDKLGKLPRTVQLQRLDEGQGVEATMVAHQAKWHKTCMLQYNDTMLRRAEKRPIASSSAFGSSDDVPGKRTRSLSSEATTSDASCFFCGESGTETLHGVATYHRNKLPLFATKRGPKILKGNQQVKSLKNDVALFARLYISAARPVMGI